MPYKTISFKVPEADIERAHAAMKVEGYENFSEWIRAMMRRHADKILRDEPERVEIEPTLLAEMLPPVEVPESRPVPAPQGFHVDEPKPDGLMDDPPIKYGTSPAEDALTDNQVLELQHEAAEAGEEVGKKSAFDCHHCAQPLALSEVVNLTLNKKTGTFHAPDDVSDDDAGDDCFFCKSCAENALKAAPDAPPAEAKPVAVVETATKSDDTPDDGHEYWDPDRAGQDRCLICHGEGRTNRSGARLDPADPPSDAITCERCDGSGKEPGADD